MMYWLCTHSLFAWLAPSTSVFHAATSGFRSDTSNWQFLANIPNLSRVIARQMDEGRESVLGSSNSVKGSIVARMRVGVQVADKAMREVSRLLGTEITSLYKITDIPVFVFVGELGKVCASYLGSTSFPYLYMPLV